MKYLNKYRIRRMVLYFCVTTIIATAVLSSIPWENYLAWQLDYDRKKIEVKNFEPSVMDVAISELTEENGYTVDQSLMLINTEHMLGEDFAAELGEYKDTGVVMNKCMLESYAKLSAGVTEFTEEKLYVTSTVRNRDEQKALYEEDPKTATLPGASEHESGLAADVYVKNFAGEAFLKSEAGQFVNTNCHKYGFIIRYPHYGKKETGIRFEPWHIRYVGLPHADIIYNNKLTLEEYIFSLKENAFYKVGNYVVTRQKPSDGRIKIAMYCKNYVISPDNTGCYVVTAEVM